MIKYSPKSARALAFLKRSYNEIDIYVEDTASPNMWLVLLRSVLPIDTRLESVNMLGGRAAVLTACQLDQADDGRRKLYIIDGDFDFLHGKRKKRLKHLYRLRGYCVENVLLSEPALVSLGLESSPQMPEQQVAAALDLAGWLQHHERMLRSLFVVYATANMLWPAIQTVKFPVSKLLIHRRGGAEICERKLTSRILSVARKVARTVGVRKFRETRKAISERASNLPLQMIASGKDYILPLVFLRLSARCSYRGTQEQFKVSLARHFVPTTEPWFVRRVNDLFS